MQHTLDTLTQEHDSARAQRLRPVLEAGLNPAQLGALLHDEGAALVLAGAGSGKTTVLTRRVARLLSEGVTPEKIFVATFTKKAAEEMTGRLISLLGEDGPAIVERVWIGTFHSHCLRLLKQEWTALHGKAGAFLIADEHWQLRVVKAILGAKDWGGRDLPSPPFGLNIAFDPKSAISTISACKNRGFRVEEAERAIREHAPNLPDPTVNTLVRIWRSYELAKQAKFDVLVKRPSRRLDFDDLLLETLWMLQDNASVRTKLQRHFTHILVDETQDTSAVQWEIARILASDHQNIFIVGDIGQAIYAFRGANPRATVAQFTAAYPDGDIVRLPTNYRSSSTIVNVANELVTRCEMDERFRLTMSSAQAQGPAPQAHEHIDADAEARWVAEQLKLLTGIAPTGRIDTPLEFREGPEESLPGTAGPENQVTPIMAEATVGEREGSGGPDRLDESPVLRLKDCAVLFRTNAYSRALEEAFVAAGVPYRLEGALGFYGRKEIRDLVAFLHVSVERDSALADEACKRIINVASRSFGKPTHFLGGTFINGVEALAAAKGISFYRALTTGQFKTNQGLAVRDFRDMVKAIAEAGDSAEARLRKARELGYDDFVTREEGDIEEEGYSRLDNLEELCVSAGAFPSAADYLNFVLAQQTKAGEEPPSDCAEMMTIHRAKGLEWAAVFVVGFAQGMLPHHRAMRFFDEEKTQIVPDSIEEERRLAYVALTRAKSHLYLSWPRIHQSRNLSRSPFLSEMPSLPEYTPAPEPSDAIADASGESPVIGSPVETSSGAASLLDPNASSVGARSVKAPAVRGSVAGRPRKRGV